ncbi:UDP-glucose dehydrogenase family protein [Metabacillus herbersteinensis]|uniref:UDP-glucose 6-dehydrogenase n=1 Tax=Metabacillus herbersteinensis TaxID=283816 RepID=A0ABV6GE31_9BACI
MNISVIGLGKLGLATAACFASKGHSVIGLDKNDFIMNELLQKRCPIDEAGLPELLEKSWEYLKITRDMKEAVDGSDITLIITPTPSNKDHRFNNEYIEQALKAIAPYLKDKAEYHIVDVVSTVMPRSSDQVFKPLLEKLTGKTCGKDFSLVYNPEFIALGSVIKNFLYPDMVLIGASDQYAADQLEKLYVTTCESSPSIAKMSLINAEITKLSLNCYVTMKISFANELASICEKVPGADIDIITDAIGEDSRVGKKYLNGGLGFGGPCFPRDNLAFQAFADEFGVKARLGKQVTEINHNVVDRLNRIIQENVNKGEKVSLLGISYKPGTHIIENSQPITFAQQLQRAGFKVALHDPKALDSAKEQLGNDIDYCEDIYHCIAGASAIVLLTNWGYYKEVDWDKVGKIANENVLLLDSWRSLKELSKVSRFNYVALGIGKE